MTWSFSEHRTFRKCPRQWFYRYVFAEARSKDAARREAYVLSKMQSISAWRGQLVDTVLGTYVVSELNARRVPTLAGALSLAKDLFEKQKEFGLKHRVREDGMVVSQIGISFAAFHQVERGEPISVEEFDRAWHDIETAIRNVWNMAELRSRVRDGKYRVAQRALQFDHCGAKVKAMPDLIVFFDSAAPLIVDWKVHSFGLRDYADQLGTYALALCRTNPHADFPPIVRRFRPHEIELCEVQLLLGTVRRHVLSEEDIRETEERIGEGVVSLQLACDNRATSDLRAEDFPTAYKEQVCLSCPFRKICWN
jgi:hypothetical protein